MSSQLASLLLPCLLIFGQSGQTAEQTQTPQQAPTRQQIDLAVEQLGDDSFGVRQRASDFLWRAGKAAEPALWKVAESDDAEVAARARRILRSFQFGVYADTPAEVVGLIGQFRFGNRTTKLAVLKRLCDVEQMGIVLLLLKKEPDDESRKLLAKGLLKNIGQFAGRLFVEGDWDKAEQLLMLGTVNEDGMRNYAAYLLLRNQLDAKIIEQKTLLGRGPQPADYQLMAYLLRAKGELTAARAVAEKAADESLTGNLMVESGAWRQLAETYDKLSRDAQGHLAGGIVNLGYAAAYHRLDGNTEKFEEAVAGIKALADAKPNKAKYCGEALLINDRFQDAVDIFTRQNATLAFDVLCAQHRFREALALAGVEDPRGPYSPWLTDSGTEEEDGQRRDRFAMGMCVGEELHRLGEDEAAARLFSELGKAAADDANLSLLWLCTTEYDLGLIDQALEHTAILLAKERVAPAFQALFPQQANAAEAWWNFLCNKYPDETRKATMQRLWTLWHPAAAGPTPAAEDPAPAAEDPAPAAEDPAPAAENPAGDDWLSLVAEAEKASQPLDREIRGKWLASLAEICLARGKRLMAMTYFEKAIAAAPSAGALTRMGDFSAQDGQWQQAAQWYGRAWEEEPVKPAPLYLQGRALLRAGRAAEGRRLIEAAVLMPLGNAEMRLLFANDLQRRGLGEEAARQWEVIVRTGEFQSAALAQAAEDLGGVLGGKDDLKAAEYLQWPLLRCLRTSRPNIGVVGYLQRVQRIHGLRARGLLAAGKIDEALGQIRLSRAALPGETALALELVPQLEKAGRRTEADELFAEVFSVNQRVCEDFPRAAGFHNNLAWLAACCNRRLDEALKHAGRAVELFPNNPPYIDTLAEVHFRRGDRQKAAELAKQCAELAPRDKHFQEQIKRFQGP